MMNIILYVAAPFVHKDLAKQAVAFFRSRGYTVTSRWVDVDETKEDPQHEARMDIADIDAAHVLVVLNCGTLSEGKAWEQGYAYAKGKPIVVVGDTPLNVFQRLPEVVARFVPTIQAADDFIPVLFG